MRCEQACGCEGGQGGLLLHHFVGKRNEHAALCDCDMLVVGTGGVQGDVFTIVWQGRLSPVLNSLRVASQYSKGVVGSWAMMWPKRNSATLRNKPRTIELALRARSQIEKSPKKEMNPKLVVSCCSRRLKQLTTARLGSAHPNLVEQVLSRARAEPSRAVTALGWLGSHVKPSTRFPGYSCFTLMVPRVLISITRDLTCGRLKVTFVGSGAVSHRSV